MIDRLKSDFTHETVKNHRTGEVYENWISDVQKLVIDESKAAGHHLFKVSWVSHFIICVSQEFQDRAQKIGITGVNFIDPDKWKEY